MNSFHLIGQMDAASRIAIMKADRGLTNTAFLAILRWFILAPESRDRRYSAW
jgi:hypothetical protein